MAETWGFRAPERLAMVRSYGVTFQNGALISSLNVAQNIQLPLREYFSMPEDALDELVQLNLQSRGIAARCRPQNIPRSYPAAWSSGPPWRGP